MRRHLQSWWFWSENHSLQWSSYRSEVANMLDGGTVVSLISGHAITFTFRLIPLGKVWISFIPLSYGLNSTTTVLLQGWLWLWLWIKKNQILLICWKRCYTLWGHDKGLNPPAGLHPTGAIAEDHTQQSSVVCMLMHSVLCTCIVAKWSGLSLVGCHK